MTLVEYLTGVLSCLATGGPLAFAAYHARSRLLPAWTGAPARLGEAVLWLALLLGLLQLLGALGLLTRAGIISGALVVGAAAWWAARRTTTGTATVGSGEPRYRAARRETTVLALVGAAVLAALWGVRMALAYRHGMSGIDALWYHLPAAAHFAETGSTADIYHSWTDPLPAFYPQNSELLHAGGLVLFGNDVLSPLITVGLVALALLAAWCCGRPRGLAPVTLLAGCALFGSYLVLSLQAADGNNDLAAVTFVLCAAALLLTGGLETRTVVLAGLAGGLAVATKITSVPTVAILVAGMVILAGRGNRVRWAVAALVPLVAAAGYWYVRNLVLVGNPAPWTALGPLGLPSPPSRFIGQHTGAIADYLSDRGIWREWLWPGLNTAFGPLWPLLIASVVVAAVMSVRSSDRARRLLGAVVLLAGAVYAFTPATASDNGFYFVANMRYAWPALAIGLVLVPLSKPFAARPRLTAALLLAVIIVASLRSAMVPSGYRWEAVLLFAVAVGAGLAWPAVRRLTGTRRMAWAGGVLLVLFALMLGRPVTERYLDHRYQDWDASSFASLTHSTYGGNLTRTYAWAQRVEDSRIAVSGLPMQYPLWGREVSNSVRSLGRPGPAGAYDPIRSCRAWWRAIDSGGYRYLVVAPDRFPFESRREAPEVAWTRSDPAAVEELREGPVVVFRLTRGRAAGATRSRRCSRRA